MQAWHFSETAYHLLPPAETYESIRVSLPNKNYDPRIGADLYHRYLDEWLLAEDEGLDIMLNEHHQTATCVDPAAPLMLAVLARQSHKARLLILGNPIANRRQPVGVAEEMAMIDVLSRGRLEAGFVRGVPYEISPANSNPVRMLEREYEALDLIVKAWTNHDGPVSFEGRASMRGRSTSGRGPGKPCIRRSGSSMTSPGGVASGWDEGTCTGNVPDRVRRASKPSSIVIGGVAREAGRKTRCRRTGSLMPPWCIPGKPRPPRTRVRKSCCGTLLRTKSRRILPILRDMFRLKPA